MTQLVLFMRPQSTTGQDNYGSSLHSTRVPSFFFFSSEKQEACLVLIFSSRRWCGNQQWQTKQSTYNRQCSYFGWCLPLNLEIMDSEHGTTAECSRVSWTNINKTQNDPSKAWQMADSAIFKLIRPDDIFWMSSIQNALDWELRFEKTNESEALSFCCLIMSEAKVDQVKTWHRYPNLYLEFR